MLEAEKKALAQLCQALHSLGQLAGSEGNVSLRAATGEIVRTPSGRHKGSLTPQAQDDYGTVYGATQIAETVTGLLQQL